MKTTSLEIEKAVECLENHYLQHAQTCGGYPAVVSIEIRGWIVIADVDHDGSATLKTMRNRHLLSVYRKAVKLSKEQPGEFDTPVDAIGEFL